MLPFSGRAQGNAKRSVDVALTESSERAVRRADDERGARLAHRPLGPLARAARRRHRVPDPRRQRGARSIVSQVLFARWMGTFEFGIYVYVWTWVLLLGRLVDLGLATAAQRFIPEYTERRQLDVLRGFLSGSRWLVIGDGDRMAALGGARRLAVRARISTTTWSSRSIIACVGLPLFALGRPAGRHRALLRLGQSRADAALHHPPAAADRRDGGGLFRQAADRRRRPRCSPRSPPPG